MNTMATPQLGDPEYVLGILVESPVDEDDETLCRIAHRLAGYKQRDYTFCPSRNCCVIDAQGFGCDPNCIFNHCPLFVGHQKIAHC